MLWLQEHARTLCWMGGVLLITLSLGTLGILQNVQSGESVALAGTVVESSSSHSIHVRVQLDSGETVLVPREHHVGLSQGDEVTLLESTSVLSTVGYRLSENATR